MDWLADWIKLSRGAVASLLLGLAVTVWVNPGTGAGWLFLFIVASGVVFVLLSLGQLLSGLVRVLRRRRAVIVPQVPETAVPAPVPPPPVEPAAQAVAAAPTVAEVIDPPADPPAADAAPESRPPAA